VGQNGWVDPLILHISWEVKTNKSLFTSSREYQMKAYCHTVENRVL